MDQCSDDRWIWRRGGDGLDEIGKEERVVLAFMEKLRD